MAFKLGNESRGFKNSSNTSIYRKSMNDGSLAQANMDGSIDVDPSVIVKAVVPPSVTAWVA